MRRATVIALVLAGLMLCLYSLPVYAGSKFLGEPSEYEVVVGVRYTSSHFREFLWGVTRPLHLWNTEQDGKKKILPFWTRPFKPGGLLGWLDPDSWKTDSSLLTGTLVTEAAAALAVAGAGD